MCEVWRFVAMGLPLVALPPWQLAQPRVAPHTAEEPEWQLMLEQVFVPTVQVKVLPLPACGLMLPLVWPLPARIDVPVVVVPAWQLKQMVAPPVPTCFW